MKNYDVCIPFTGIIWVTVEAESEEDAIEKAFVSDELKVEDCEEWNAHRRICTGNVLHATCNEAYAVEAHSGQ